MLEEVVEDQEEKISIYTIILRVGSIESGPPLSTILGNHGINTISFVKELNDYLIDAPNYYFLRIKIIIYLNENNLVNRYVFEVFEPSLFQIFKILSYKKVLNILKGGKYEDITIKVINIEDIYSACFIKFGYIDESILKMAYGLLKSSNIKIFDEEDDDEENDD